MPAASVAALRVGGRHVLGGLPRCHRLLEAALTDERLSEEIAGLEVGTGAERQPRQPLSEIDLADGPSVARALDQRLRIRPVADLRPPRRYSQGGPRSEVVMRLEDVRQSTPDLVESRPWTRALARRRRTAGCASLKLDTAGLRARADESTTLQAGDHPGREQVIDTATGTGSPTASTSRASRSSSSRDPSRATRRRRAAAGPAPAAHPSARGHRHIGANRSRDLVARAPAGTERCRRSNCRSVCNAAPSTVPPSTSPRVRPPRRETAVGVPPERPDSSFQRPRIGSGTDSPLRTVSTIEAAPRRRDDGQGPPKRRRTGVRRRSPSTNGPSPCWRRLWMTARSVASRPPPTASG